MENKILKKILILFKTALSLLAIISLLSGCSDLVEVQDRDFVLALGVSLKNDKYELTFSLPDLSALTKGEKDGENNGDSGQTRTYTSASLAEIEDLYNHGSNKRLDYRHLEALILDEKISSSTKMLSGIFEYIGDNYEVSRNVRVFYYSGDVKELLETKGKISGGIGNYLKKLENNNQRKYSLPSVTIGNLMDSFSQKKGLVIPLLELKEDKLEVSGAAVFQDAVYVRTLTEEELKIYYVIKGFGKDLNFYAQEDRIFKLKEYKSKTRYLYHDNKPTIQLAITGTAEILSNPNENGTDAEVSEYMKNAVLNQITTCFYGDKTDYINFYDECSLKNRNIWLDYQNRRDDFINDAIFDVSVDIQIQ